MDCLTLTCLITLFSPSNLYVTGQVLAPLSDSRPHNEGMWCNKGWCRGPVGEMRVGFRAELTTTIEIDLGVAHRSYIADGDRGYEAAFASLTWRPFR
jgi:hypothetical protein